MRVNNTTSTSLSVAPARRFPIIGRIGRAGTTMANRLSSQARAVDLSQPFDLAVPVIENVRNRATRLGNRVFLELDETVSRYRTELEPSLNRIRDVNDTLGDWFHISGIWGFRVLEELNYPAPDFISDDPCLRRYLNPFDLTVGRLRFRTIVRDGCLDDDDDDDDDEWVDRGGGRRRRHIFTNRGRYTATVKFASVGGAGSNWTEIIGLGLRGTSTWTYHPASWSSGFTMRSPRVSTFFKYEELYEDPSGGPVVTERGGTAYAFHPPRQRVEPGGSIYEWEQDGDMGYERIDSDGKRVWNFRTKYSFTGQPEYYGDGRKRNEDGEWRLWNYWMRGGTTDEKLYNPILPGQEDDEEDEDTKKPPPEPKDEDDDDMDCCRTVRQNNELLRRLYREMCTCEDIQDIVEEAVNPPVNYSTRDENFQALPVGVNGSERLTRVVSGTVDINGKYQEALLQEVVATRDVLNQNIWQIYQYLFDIDDAEMDLFVEVWKDRFFGDTERPTIDEDDSTGGDGDHSGGGSFGGGDSGGAGAGNEYDEGEPGDTEEEEEDETPKICWVEIIPHAQSRLHIIDETNWTNLRLNAEILCNGASEEEEDACKNVIPLMPDERFAQIPVPSQLVLTFGTEYPTQNW